MLLKKSIISLIFILLFSISFNLGTTNQTIAAIGDPCPEEIQNGTLCPDGGLCSEGICVKYFSETIGQYCFDSSLPNNGEGAPCSDGSLCYDSFCKATCDKDHGELCNINDPSEGRCYSEGDIKICKTTGDTPFSKENDPCGLTEGSICLKTVFDEYDNPQCPTSYEKEGGGVSCKEAEDGTNLICCKSEDSQKLKCPTLEYGDECSDGSYCYDGICEPAEPKGEVGDLCGNDGGGVCTSIAGSTGCPGDMEHDASGGRSCEGTWNWCCIDNNNLPPSTCKNKEPGDSCGDGGYCYNDQCVFEKAQINEVCGTSGDGICKEGIPDNLNSRWFCDVGEIEEYGGRSCSTTLSNGNPLRCCSPKQTPPPPKNNFDASVFNPDYQTCEDINQAQPDEGGSGGLGIFKRSIVPCGRSCDNTNTNYNEMDECTICHFIIMGKNIYDLVIALIVIISLLMITAGGVLYMISGANPNMNSMAKEIIKKTLIGFTLFLASWLIVNTILMIISARPGGMLGSSGTWFEFTCDTKSAFQQDYNNLP